MLTSALQNHLRENVLQPLGVIQVLHSRNALHLLPIQSLRDIHENLVRIALRHQIPLSVQRVSHFLHLTAHSLSHLRVAAHQRVEERLGARAQSHLRPQNATQSLRLLPSRTFLALHLDQHRRFGQVNRRVSDLRQKHDVLCRALTKLRQHALALRFRRAAVQHRIAENLLEFGQGIDGVAKHQDLVSTPHTPTI